MSSLITEAIIRASRGTAAAWTSADTVLEAGEWGYETDTGKAKIGDGTTAWTSLGYAAETGIVATVAGNIQIFHVQDQQTSGTNGGTFTLGAWRTRVLNTTVTNTISNASLASNRVTLPAGTYEIYARTPAYSVDRHAARLYNITDTAELLSGSGSICLAANSETQTDSIILGRITLSGTTIIELQHRSQSTKAGNGLGVAMGGEFAVGNEIYSEVHIRRVV